MRILAVTPYYAPEGGGLERYAHAVLSRLALRGHEVVTLAMTRTGLQDSKADAVDVRRMAARFGIGNTPIHAGFYANVLRHIRQHRPDVVVAHTPVPFPAEMAYLAARRAGVPFVLTYHAGSLRGSTRRLGVLAALNRETLERQMISGAQQVIAVGPYVRDHALSRRAGGVTLVPPGVDATRFRPVAAVPGRNILFVAPLDQSYHWKGVDVLWNAFEIVRKTLPDATLTLIGAGNRLVEFRARLALGGSVRILGNVADDELVHEYQRAAVIALPSTTDAEAFGMVLAEANACGRPVVASRIGGIPDFVQHGHNGLLAEPGNAQELAARLVGLLANPKLAQAMGRRGRQHVVRHHDWADLTVRTEEAYAKAADSRAS